MKESTATACEVEFTYCMSCARNASPLHSQELRLTHTSSNFSGSTNSVNPTDLLTLSVLLSRCSSALSKSFRCGSWWILLTGLLDCIS